MRKARGGGVQLLRRLTSQERRGQRRHPGRRRLQSLWGGVLLVLRLPPRPRVLKDSWPHSGPCLRLSPWGCVVARLGKGHCDAQAFMP